MAFLFTNPVSTEGTWYDQYYDEMSVDKVDIPTVPGTNAYDNVSGFNAKASSEMKDIYAMTYGSSPTATKVLGMPMLFNPLADPFNRVYNTVFENDAPIVYIMPGLPKLNKKLRNDGEINRDKIFFEGVSQGISVSNVKNYNDMRFINFEPSYALYCKYVDTILNYTHSLLGLSGNFSWEDGYDKLNNYGLAYFCNKASTISENLSSSYGETQMAQNANQNAAQEREFQQLYALSRGQDEDNVKSEIDKMFQEVSEIPAIGKIIAPLGRTANGSQLYYPEIWSDSRYEKSYTVSMKLFSPYGDRDSIFRFLYTPFISILCLVCPRQDGIYGYSEPFLVRASCPGYFETECGCIESIEYTRGGDDSLWTSEGFPNEINVTFAIKDLYPSLPITYDFGNLKFNGGLVNFMECMAGLRSDQLNLKIMAKAKFHAFTHHAKDKLTFKNLRRKLTGDLPYKGVQAVKKILL